MKKLLPTCVPKVLANYVKPRLNESVLEVMQNNEISLFTKPSTSTDDLSDMDLKLKLMDIIHLNKTHPTNQKLYDTLYDSILLDQDALDAQEAEPSIHKRSYDHQDPSTEDTPADQPQVQEDLYVQERPNAGWFTKKSGSAYAAKRRTTWFDMLLKYDIDQNENHILGLSNVAIAKKLKELIQKDELTIADLKGDVSKPKSFKSHMSKSTKPHLSFYNNDFYYLIEALNGIHHREDGRQHFFKAEINNKTPGNVYFDKRIIFVVRVVMKRKWGYGFLSSIVVKRSDKKEYTFSYADLSRLNLNDIEDMYLLKVQDKLHHLELEFEKDFNNALLLFIRRTVIKNRVEDVQLGVESYQRTLNLTKPKI
ncbi:hypothetical protein Tco_0236681 [Tanacetum coccineum]